MAAKKELRSQIKVRQFQNKPLLILTGMILLIAFAVVLVYSEQNLTGNVTVQTVSYMKAGTELYSEPNFGILKYVRLQIAEDFKNAQIYISEVDHLSWTFRGVIISKFKISSSDDDKLGAVELTLKIPQTELAAKGLKNEEVRVYQDGQELPTTLQKVEGDYVFYIANAETVGEFLVGKSIPEQQALAGQAVLPPSLAQETAPVVEQPIVVEKPGFFGRIGNFFKGLFE